MRIAAHEDDFEGAEIERRLCFLRNDRDPAGQVAPRQRAERDTVDRDAAARRLEGPGEQPYQRGLSGSIGPEQAHNRSASYVQRHILKDKRVPACAITRPVPEGDVIGL